MPVSPESTQPQESFRTALHFWRINILKNPDKFISPTNRFATAFGHGAVLLADQNNPLMELLLF